MIANIEIRARVKCHNYCCERYEEIWVTLQDSASQPGAVTVGTPPLPEGWGYIEEWNRTGSMVIDREMACPDHSEVDRNWKPIERPRR